jgi:hypothetical protein
MHGGDALAAQVHVHQAAGVERGVFQRLRQARCRAAVLRQLGTGVAVDLPQRARQGHPWWRRKRLVAAIGHEALGNHPVATAQLAQVVQHGGAAVLQARA